MVLLRRAWVENRGLLIVAHVGALIPLARLGWAYQQGTLQVDPVGMITMRTGRAGLTLLLLSLACTPLITLTGWEAVGRLRRELGLYAAAYVGLHALTFLGLDYGFAWSLIGRAIWQQRLYKDRVSHRRHLLAMFMKHKLGKRMLKQTKLMHKQLCYNKHKLV